VRAESAENDVLIYERVNDGQRMIVMLNFSAEPQPLPTSLTENADVLLSTHMDREGSCGLSELRGNEGIVVVMSGAMP
jgi:hypothetical protein